jgi:hypothetical protein
MIGYIAIARAFLSRVPVWVWVALAVAGLLAWERDRHADNREAETRAEMQNIIDKKEAERLAALESEEQALRTLSKETDRAVIQAQDDNRDRTERFIAAGGVRTKACPATDQAAVRSAGDSAPVHQAPVMDGAEPLPTVAVTPDDVRTCTTNTILAEQWRELLLDLEAR